MIIDAESTLVGLCMQEPKCLEIALAIGLKAEHFDNPRLALIFAEMIRADENRQSFGLTSLAVRLGNSMIDYLVGLTELTSGGLNPKYLANLVIDGAFKRQALSELQDVTSWIKGTSQSVDATEVRAKISGSIEKLAVESSVNVESLMSASEQFFERVDASYSEKFNGSAFGVSTGLPNLDVYLNGFRPGALYIIGGRPGTGKSEVCCNLAYNIASQLNPIAYFTFEMTAEEIAGRIISRVSRVSDSKLLAAQASDDDFDRLTAVIPRIKDLPLYIIDNIKPQWDAIKLRIRSMARTHKIKVAVIDYIQQLSASGFKPQDRVRELSLISSEAKQLAKELNISIVCAAQLNRQSNDRDDTPPQSRHLKESGSLEQDANVILLIHRKAQGYDLIIAKNRHGQEGAIPIRADFEFHTITEGR